MLLSDDKSLGGDRLLILKRFLVLRVFVLTSLIFYVFVFAHHRVGLMTVGLLSVASIVYSLIICWRYFFSRLLGRIVPTNVLLMQLLWDAAVIVLFVCFIGRSTNPFIYYLLVLTAISASIFREKSVWLFSFASIGVYSVLMYLDVNQHINHINGEFRAHLLGMWINFVGSALLISFFISRLTSALNNHERALGLAREEILKNEQLIGIGTLAASTVHSFGTPLSTISMASGELAAMHRDQQTQEYTAIIQTQIERCKSTMAKLSLLAGHKSSPLQTIKLTDLIDELKEHFLLMNATPMPRFAVNVSLDPCLLPGGILLLHALINLVDNAVQAAKTAVFIRVTHSSRVLHIHIDDDGDGLPPEVLEHFGEIIVNSKTGLGMGFLLANSTLERLGGKVQFSHANVADEQPLTRVTVDIPLYNQSDKS